MPAKGMHGGPLGPALASASYMGQGRMAAGTEIERLAAGKIAGESLERIILPYLGARRDDVLVGPRQGIDTGIVDLGGGQVMAVTADPFFVMPALGWERAAWFAVHIVASDAATSGLEPVYLAIDLNLPSAMTDAELAALWQSTAEICAALGVAVVTGHTGRYEGCDYPMLGGATMLCVGRHDAYVTPDMALPGDSIIVTKGAAIETTGMIGALCPNLLARSCGEGVARAADALFEKMTVVEDARVAAAVGVREAGVTGMHDATERGIWGGLREIAEAAGVGLAVDADAIILRPEVRAVCDYLHIDPFATSSEGTLLITCRPGKTGEVVARLGDAGIAASCAGEVVPASQGVRVTAHGREEPLLAPRSDPFWPALHRAMREEAARDA